MRLLLILLFLFNFFFSDCSEAYEDSKEKRLNLWPFIVYKKDKEQNQEYLELFGPFVYKYHTHEEKGLSLRPFVSFVETPEEKKAFFLSPLGMYREDNETTTFKLVPLVKKRGEKENSEGFSEKHFDLFPFFWGRTSKNETYWGVFPLYGRLKERFGRDEIQFFLWPLYSRVTYEEYVATNILWPFIRFTSARTQENSQRYSGFKIWPLYGHFREGDEERRFFLWPFYIKQSYRDEYNSTDDKLFIFPFYVREQTDLYERKIYLWPFIQVVTAQDPFYRQIDAPWPFYRKISGENIEGLRIFPFYGYTKRTSSLEYFILWPFYFYSEYKDESSQSILEKQHRFLLLSKYLTEFNNDTLTLKELRIWPLFYKYKNYESQILIYHFPALIPIINEGIERNYSPLLKLYETIENNNKKITKALWGLYRHEINGNRHVYELAFVMRRVCDENTNYIEFFEGLFGIGKIDGKPVLRIFFVNWKK